MNIEAITIIKFAGFFSAVAITVYEHIEKERSRIKPPGKRRLKKTRSYSSLLFGLKLLGITIAIACLMLETNKSSADARKADLAAQADRMAKGLILTNVMRQLDLQRQSIAYIERLVGTLDTMSASIVFEVVTNHPTATQFRNRVIEMNQEPELKSGFKQNIVGYVNGQNATSIVYIEPAGVQCDTLEKVTGSNWLAQNASDNVLASFLNCLSNLQLNVALFSARNSERSWSESDLYAAPSAHPGSPHVAYQKQKDRVILTYDIKLPANAWRHSQRISTIPDLADATVWLIVSNCPAALQSSLLPVALTFDFDKATITTTNGFAYEYRDSPFVIKIQSSIGIGEAIKEDVVTMTRRFRQTNIVDNIYVSKLPPYDKLMLDPWILGK